MRRKAGRAQVAKRGTVRRIIEPFHHSLPEKAEISVYDAEDLYREIRIENELHDPEGNSVRLKKNAEVDIVIEADRAATTDSKRDSESDERTTEKTDQPKADRA